MPKLSDIFIALKFWGFKNTLRTIRYTFYRDWLNWSYSRQIPLHKPQTAGDIVEIKSQPSGVQQIIFTNFQLQIQFLTQRLVRVRWQSHAGARKELVPYAIAKTKWPPITIEHRSILNGELFISEQIQIFISKKGDLSFLNPGGHVVHRDISPQLTDKGWLLQSNLTPAECIYGLGEQSEGLNLRGSSHKMVNTDAGGSYGPNKDPLYMPIPVYIGVNEFGGYLVFHENTYPGNVYIDSQLERDQEKKGKPGSQQESLLSVKFESPTLQYYVILGDPPQLLEQFTELTGKAPLPPLWSLGYHQSRWGYASEKDIQDIVAGFNEHQMPVSAIHLDIDYMDGFRVFTVDQARYPDLRRLCQELEENSVKLVTILDPGVKIDSDYEIYSEGLRDGHFCTLPNGKPVNGLVWPGWSVYPDFTNPQTRAWWGSKYSKLYEKGIAGFWHDMNEPTSFSSWGGLYLPHSTQHQLDGHKGDHHEAHNVYALQMNRAGYEAQKECKSDARPWILSRSGWAGNQRYAWNWTGDTESTWESLKMTLTTIIGLGLSGIPYTGSDIGGFSGNPPPELYLRWFQLACMMPFFRTHSAIGTPAREPWVFGEPYTTIIRNFLHLRYKIMPYLYTLAWEASQTGAPLIRPLFWYYPDIFEYRQVQDEFFLGSDLLIAPVLVEGSQKREVLFPPGIWFNYWIDTDPITGPCTLSVDIDLSTLPIFVRSGSAIPMTTDGQLQLHIYPPELNPEKDVQYNGCGQLYMDKGDGFGPNRLDQFYIIQRGNNFEVNWDTASESEQETYLFPHERLNIILHGFEAQEVHVDGVITPYTGRQLDIKPFKRLLLRSSIK